MELTEAEQINIKKKKVGRPIYFGVNAETGELLSVADVPRGLACRCICPACDTALIAKKGVVKAHHFAHELNNECLYGAEIAIYYALYNALKKELHLVIPEAILEFRSNKKYEIVSEEQDIELTDVKMKYNQAKYPPELVCYKGEHRIQIILDIEEYYNEADIAVCRQSGIDRDTAILRIEIDDISETIGDSEIHELIYSPYGKSWIYNRLAAQYDKKYKSAAKAPPLFENRYLCAAQKGKYKNVYAVVKIRCYDCNYCYDNRSDNFCLAQTRIDGIEDFQKQSAALEKEFIEKNNLSPIKKIEEFSCPKCGAPMRRRKGKNGVFAGCSRYPECNGSRNVEQNTEQVIIVK